MLGTGFWELRYIRYMYLPIVIDRSWRKETQHVEMQESSYRHSLSKDHVLFHFSLVELVVVLIPDVLDQVVCTRNRFEGCKPNAIDYGLQILILKVALTGCKIGRAHV